MKIIQHIQTLFYCDGPQVFEARDAIDGHYVAVMVEPKNERDRYLVTGVAPEQLREFRSGKVDLRSLMLSAGDEVWYLVEIEEGLDHPLKLLPQKASLLFSGFLPEPGFLLHKDFEQVDALAHYKLTAGVEALTSLKDGWLEGHGVAPNSEHLNWLSNEMAKVFPDSLEYPAVVPTEDGNVVFEWIRPQARIELEVNFAGQKLELYSTNLKKNDFVEATYPQDGWAEAFAKVSTLLVYG